MEPRLTVAVFGSTKRPFIVQIKALRYIGKTEVESLRMKTHTQLKQMIILFFSFSLTLRPRVMKVSSFAARNSHLSYPPSKPIDNLDTNIVTKRGISFPRGIGRFRLTTRMRTKAKFDDKEYWGIITLVANPFHRLDTKTKTIKDKQ